MGIRVRYSQKELALINHTDTESKEASGKTLKPMLMATQRHREETGSQGSAAISRVLGGEVKRRVKVTEFRLRSFDFKKRC